MKYVYISFLMGDSRSGSLKPLLRCLKNLKRISLLVFLLLLISSISLYANGDVVIVGRNFLRFKNAEKQIVSLEMLEGNEVNPNAPRIPVAFLLRLGNGGYILVSASRDLTPIKAYSFKNDFEMTPEAYQRFLLLEMEYNIRAQHLLSFKTKGIRETENNTRWNFLLNYNSKYALYQPDTFLLSSTWSQFKPYDKFIPQVNGINAKPGCVSISLGQIMRYYQYPSYGKGVLSYKWGEKNLKGVFNKRYHWQHMPDYLDMGTTVYKIDAVARLLRDLGIANETNFGPNNSWTTVKLIALQKHFGYSTALAEMEKMDGMELFFQTLRNEINADRPVLIQFPNHMTVADGYNSDPSGNNIHINFGWGGSDDGFYYLDRDVVTSNMTLLTEGLKMIYNIKPCTGGDCYNNLETEDHINGSLIIGRFNSAIDTDEYEVYLKGKTTITGYRGFANQAFYVSLYDCQNNFILTDDNPLTANLNTNKYTIKASLCNADSCYKFDVYLNYSININTQNVTNDEKLARDANCDTAPEINNELRDMILTHDDLPLKILIDAYDENADILSLTASSSNPYIIAHFDDANGLLVIDSNTERSDIISRITLTAIANGKRAEKDFRVMIMNENIFFGKAFVINGGFLNQNTYNVYSVILDGNCSISGFRGFQNQAFFLNVMNLGVNYVVMPTDDEISHGFLKNQYLLGASLWEDPIAFSGQHYIYEEGHNDVYEISGVCPDASNDVYAIFDLLGLDSSPNISANTTNYSYGGIAVNSTSSQIFTITNIGLGDLSILDISLSGLDANEFFIEADNCTGANLAQFETCHLDLSFSPDTAGVKSAGILITSNDPDTQMLHINVSGAGKQRYYLEVEKTGTGSGRVITNPPGIDCGTVCSGMFIEGTGITLEAIPNEGSDFIGWSGEGCTGHDPCVLILDSDKSVLARFDGASPVLSITISSTGSGQVFPSGMLYVNRGDDLTLTMTPGPYNYVAYLIVNDSIIEGTGQYTIHNVLNNYSLAVIFEQNNIKHVGGHYLYHSIQEAINHAEHSDLIIVHDGTYTENLNFLGKSITVRSENGPFKTIIDGNGSGSVVHFNNNEDSNTTLIGFCIRNGYAQRGGGIRCENTSPKIIRCHITSNYASIAGGGIYSLNRMPVIINSLIWNNQNIGEQNQISIERDLAIYNDLAVLRLSDNTHAMMCIYNQFTGRGRYIYNFFSGINAPITDFDKDDFLFISLSGGML